MIISTLLDPIGHGLRLYDGKEYKVTGALMKKISEMPDLIKWIMMSVLNADRHIIIFPFD